MVHLLDRIIAVLVLEETDAEAVELLDDFVAILRVLIDGLLIDNAVVRDGYFLRVGAILSLTPTRTLLDLSSPQSIPVVWRVAPPC